MFYKASLDLVATLITSCTFILFIGIGGYAFYEATAVTADSAKLLLAIGVNTTLILIFLGCWMYAPKGYEVTKDELIIYRKIGNIKILKTSISEVRLLDKSELLGVTRTLGVGGLFGYFGAFTIPKIGETTFYTTQSKNLILIVTDTGKKKVISPNHIKLLKQLHL